MTPLPCHATHCTGRGRHVCRGGYVKRVDMFLPLTVFTVPPNITREVLDTEVPMSTDSYDGDAAWALVLANRGAA
jgi:hypothetical protein